MTDPRERKLPKWAQELLEQERLKNALRYPDRPCPKPDVFEHVGHAQLPRGRWVYTETSAGVFKHYVCPKSGYLFHDETCLGSGSQARNEFYFDLKDARLAHRWRVANYAAEALLRAETEEPR